MGIVEDIKNRITMKDLLSFYGIEPKRSFNNYLCLFHDDTRPSAGITKSGNKFHCFACGITASIFDIVCKIKQCDFKTAIKIIDTDFNLGLVGQLTHKEKLELARQQKERERLKAQKEELARFEFRVLNKIIKELKVWRKCEKLTHITRGEYRKGEWKYSDLYFHSLERQVWLNWLYETICGFKDKKETEFDYIYGSDKNNILTKINKGEICI